MAAHLRLVAADGELARPEMLSDEGERDELAVQRQLNGRVKAGRRRDRRVKYSQRRSS
jgi:hypothetical protein